MTWIGGKKGKFILRNPVHRYTKYKHQRGKSTIPAWRDWLGGFFANPALEIDFCQAKGFVLEKLLDCGDALGKPICFPAGGLRT